MKKNKLLLILLMLAVHSAAFAAECDSNAYRLLDESQACSTITADWGEASSAPSCTFAGSDERGSGNWTCSN